MRLFPWWERLIFNVFPGHCPLCLGRPVQGLPWCHMCYMALPRNLRGCSSCAEPLPERSISKGICARCEDTPLFIHRIVAPLIYQGEIAWLIRKYKTQHAFQAGRLIFELVWSVLQETDAWHEAREAEAIIAVPPDRTRTLKRGFDPVAWLAQRAGRLLNLPLVYAYRKEGIHSQRGLGREERWRNMKDVFQLHHVLPRRILLFDDVVTTGATLDSLARVCFEQGTEWVGALALARTPPRSDSK